MEVAFSARVKFSILQLKIQVHVRLCQAPQEQSGDTLATVGLETTQPIKQPDSLNVPGSYTIYIYKGLNIDP